MDVVLVPGGMRFSVQVDAGVERALRVNGHQVRTLCRDCLTTIGQGALAQLKADLLLTVHGRLFPHAVLKSAEHIRAKAVWLVDEPQEVDLSECHSRHFDIVFTNDRNTCGVHGPHKCWYLPLAADPEVHRKAEVRSQNAEVTSAFGLHTSALSADVCFVGGILPERAKLLDEAYQRAPDLAWRIAGPDRNARDVNFASVWDRRRVSHGEYVGAVRSARIVLDIPRDEMFSFAGKTNRRRIPATGVGCRPFEVTACGGFLLTDDSRGDIFTMFPRGTIGVYRAGDAADLVAQVRYWLAHEEEREERARLARTHCLREHTYAVRVRQLVAMVQAWLTTRLPSKTASPRRAAQRPGSEGPKT